MRVDLSGKQALVGGSSQGIGRAIAVELAAQGAAVTVLGRNAERLEQVRGSLPAPMEQTHQVLVADFCRPEEVRAAVREHVQTNAVQILVNNTGGPPPGPAHLAEPGAFLAAFQQHLICNQILVQAVLPGMRAAGYGRIINIISTSVKQPIPNLGVSNTIRGAVANWAKTLAGELGPLGITVNNVLPGATATGRLAAILDNRAAKQGRTVEAIEAEERELIPARRFGRPEEIAFVVAFLASAEAGYVTGINLPVDGGRTACL